MRNGKLPYQFYGRSYRLEMVIFYMIPLFFLRCVVVKTTLLRPHNLKLGKNFLRKSSKWFWKLQYDSWE